jgi:hypothetical protein
VVGDWTSHEFYEALKLAVELFGPDANFFGHGSPTRWVASSNPVEVDDPWQGGEASFFMNFLGNHLKGWCYQTPHGMTVYTKCECPDRDKPFGHRDECWLNRWEDGVARLAAGYHGWRKMIVVLMETCAYEFYRKYVKPPVGNDIASEGKTVADKWHVEVGYGNGIPWELL